MDGNIPDTPPVVVVPRPEDRAAWEKTSARLAGDPHGDGAGLRSAAEPVRSVAARAVATKASTHPLGDEDAGHAAPMCALWLKQAARLS